MSMDDERKRFIGNQAFVSFRRLPQLSLQELSIDMLDQLKKSALDFLDTNTTKWYENTPDISQPEYWGKFYETFFQEMDQQVALMLQGLPPQIFKVFEHENQIFIDEADQKFDVAQNGWELKINLIVGRYLNRLEAYVYWSSMIIHYLRAVGEK